MFVDFLLTAAFNGIKGYFSNDSLASEQFINAYETLQKPNPIGTEGFPNEIVKLIISYSGMEASKEVLRIFNAVQLDPTKLSSQNKKFLKYFTVFTIHLTLKPSRSSTFKKIAPMIGDAIFLQSFHFCGDRGCSITQEGGGRWKWERVLGEDQTKEGRIVRENLDNLCVGVLQQNSKSLQSFECSWVPVSTVVRAVQAVPSLTSLTLDFQTTHDPTSLCKAITSLQNLVSLRINTNGYIDVHQNYLIRFESSVLISIVNSCSKLRTLSLRSMWGPSPITDESLIAIASSGITELDISYTHTGASGLANLAGSSLKSLSICEHRAAVTQILGIHSLTALDVSYDGIPLADLERLQGLRNLRHLICGGSNSRVDQSIVESFKKSISSLQSLCPNLSVTTQRFERVECEDGDGPFSD